MKRLATAALAVATAVSITTVPAIAQDNKDNASSITTNNDGDKASSELSSDLKKDGENGSSNLGGDKKEGDKASSELNDLSSKDGKKESDLSSKDGKKDGETSTRDVLLGLGILAALIGVINFAMQQGLLPFKF